MRQKAFLLLENTLAALMVPIDYQATQFPEAFVFGDIAGCNAAKIRAAHTTLTHQDSEIALSCVINDLQQPVGSNIKSHKDTSRRLLNNLQKLMWRDVGVLRDTEKLQRALGEVRRLREDVFPSICPKQGTAFNTSLMDWLDLRNSLLCQKPFASLRVNERKAGAPTKWKTFPINLMVSQKIRLYRAKWPFSI